MASQARHETVSPQETNASRFVVPWGEGASQPAHRLIHAAWNSAVSNWKWYYEATVTTALKSRFAYVRPGRLKPEVTLPISVLEMSLACASA